MMIITPLISVKYSRTYQLTSANNESQDNSVIKVMSSDNGFIKSVDTREYLIGCVAGEMPASYHEEALKAQAVASYTYAKYISNRDYDKLGGADISDDSSIYQSYIDENARKEKWGDSFSKNEKLISDVVDSVLYEYLSFENEPIMAVYHNMCSGKTEACENVWGNSVEYLVSVTSDGDKLSPDFQTETKIKENEFFEKLGVEKGDIDIVSRYPSGIVEEIKISQKAFTGANLRDAFSLKSADFDVEIKDGNVTITCRGNGHFVGMSQYGADFLARQGSTYDEILSHYYPKTQLLSIKK